MNHLSHEGAVASFNPVRPKLMRVAYRMLGSVADAEDVLQEAFIRWMEADRAEVREPEDVSVHADGGGKRPAAPTPIVGFDAVMKLQEYLASFFQKNASKLVRAGFVNGLPGFVTLEADGELQTTALEIEDGKIAAIYVMRNPDKLKHLH
jgi:hypothetical protein